MPILYILQWGKERSIVIEYYHDTKERTVLIMDNQYLMNLDELGLVQWKQTGKELFSIWRKKKRV